jgi:hypothetical protein
MAKSSINIKIPTSHSTAHNNRAVAPSYLIIWVDENEKKQVNEFVQFPKFGKQNRDDILELAQERYKEKFNQSMQKKQADSFWKEAIVNIKKEHTSEDIIKLFERYNQELSYTPKDNSEAEQKKARSVKIDIQEIAIHKDEGVFVDTKYNVDEIHYDHDKKLWFDLTTGNNITHEVETYRPNRDVFYNQDTKKWYLDRKFTKEFDSDSMQIYFNYHAHVTFTQFDFDTCKSARLDARDMVKIQDITADELGMERGKKTRYSEKQIQEIQEQLKPIEEYESNKEYGKEFNRVARELGHLKPKKAKSKHHMQLKDEAQEQDYNFREMQKYITSLENASVEDKKELHRLNSAVKNHKATIEELQEQVTRYKGLYEVRESTAVARLEIMRQQEDEINELKSTVNDLKSKNEALVEENLKKDEKINSSSNMDVLEHEAKEFIEEQLEVKLKKEGFTIPKAIKWLVDKVKDFKEKIAELTAENKGLKAQNEMLKATVELHNERLEDQSERPEVDDWWKKQMAKSTEFSNPTENSNKIDEIVKTKLHKNR